MKSELSSSRNASTEETSALEKEVYVKYKFSDTIMIIFDYIFYRIAKFFCKKDGIDAARATCILSLIQYLLVAIFVMFFVRLFYPVSETAPYAKLIGKIASLPVLIVWYLNHKLYKNRYWRFADRWRNKETTLQLYTRGFLVVFAIILPFILMCWLISISSWLTLK